jgi:hypothetical protein
LYSTLPASEDIMCYHVILMFNQGEIEISELTGEDILRMLCSSYRVEHNGENKI